MEMQQKNERQLSAIEKLPLDNIVLILGFLSDLKSIKNFALTCKKHSVIVSFFLEHPECLMSEYFSLEFLQTLLKDLDEKKVLKDQINLAVARKDLKTELDLITAIQVANPQQPLQFVTVDRLFVPPNNDLANATTSSYQNIGQIMSTRLNHSSARYLSPQAFHTLLKTFLTCLAIYLILHRHFPESLDISTYIPRSYLTPLACITSLLSLSIKFNLPEVMASFYARYQQNNLRELVEKPIATITPPTATASTLANYRDNIFKVLKRKAEKENSASEIGLEDLPEEVKDNLSVKKSQ